MSPNVPTMEMSELTSLLPKDKLVAYFCAEFAIEEALPMYAGGLGVLAGDLLAQANEEQLPFIGVSLLYRKGYMKQEISKDANIFEEEGIDLTNVGMKLLEKDGQPIIVTVPIGSREVRIQCFVKMLGTVPILFLDTFVDGNDSHDMTITDRLYFGDKEHRFEQEMVLGIGGMRLLKQLAIEPTIYHLNEGHSALMLFELARVRCDREERPALSEVLSHLGNVVFTNHTIVAAGNDVYSKDLVHSYMDAYALEFPIDPSELIKYGMIEDTSLFSTTMLALRLATVSQAVSKLHAKKALELWSHHPMTAITNGVRQKYWQSEEIANAGKESEKLWQAHRERKRKLCTLVKQVTGTEWGEDDFIVAWSRRIAKYKRPLAIFEEKEKLFSLFKTSKVPLRIVMSGKPHMSDDGGQKDLYEILKLVGESQGHVVYIQNYSLDSAKTILAGADVLVNTPVRGFEASGTSGMKAGINGVLACTVLDGWTDEVDWKELGWVLDSANPGKEFFSYLNNEMLPMYERKIGGVDNEWVERMRRMIDVVEAGFTAHRMLQELQTLVYSQLESEKL